jgi:hypothetical protein
MEDGKSDEPEAEGNGLRHVDKERTRPLGGRVEKAHTEVTRTEVADGPVPGKSFIREQPEDLARAGLLILHWHLESIDQHSIGREGDHARAPEGTRRLLGCHCDLEHGGCGGVLEGDDA